MKTNNAYASEVVKTGLILSFDCQKILTCMRQMNTNDTVGSLQFVSSLLVDVALFELR